MVRSPAPVERLPQRALNRALLARQGLLDRLHLPLVEAVESVGAVQAQHWPAVPVALWSRVSGFEAEHLHGALERRQLVTGILLRGTLHLVSARQRPAYAPIAEEVDARVWGAVLRAAPLDVAALRGALLAHATARPLSAPELVAFIEAWVARHAPDAGQAELAPLRARDWPRFRRSSMFVRAPADGRWGSRAPDGYLAPPASPPGPGAGGALAMVVQHHLRAFGPAAAEDVASWMGWRTPPVRETLERLAPELARFEDEAGRSLYDLPGAPRPSPEVAAPPRFLAAFDSALLAYAPRRRARILPDEHRERVYVRANLQLLPTFLVDGLVAGTWSIEVRRRAATLTLRPFARMSRPARAALVDEAERLVRFSQPSAAVHHVMVEA